MKKYLIVTNRALISLIALLISNSCTTEIVDFSKTCSLKGKVVACDEFGIENQDDGKITVTLENTTFSTTTDESGSFTLNDVPNGIYYLVLEKAGYGTRIIREISVFTYKDTIKLNPVELLQVSSIEITNFRIEKDGNFLYAKGTIVHKFPKVSPEMTKYPSIRIFVNDTPDVSAQNFMHGGSGGYDVSVPSGSEFKTMVSPQVSQPYSNDKPYYCIAYGNSASINSYYNYVWDPEVVNSVRYETLLGKPSNVYVLTNKN